MTIERFLLILGLAPQALRPVLPYSHSQFLSNVVKKTHTLSLLQHSKQRHFQYGNVRHQQYHRYHQANQRPSWLLQVAGNGARLSSTWVGPMQQMVEESLMVEFNPSHLEVINESHGQLTDESHFKVIIVSDEFEGKNLVNRHRLVNAALSSSIKTDENDSSSMSTKQLPFHSLTITAKTPEQWGFDNSVPDSPRCAGGDGGK